MPQRLFLAAIRRVLARLTGPVAPFARALGIALAVMLALAVIWATVLRPRQLATQAATAKIAAAQANASAGAARDTITIQRDHDREVERIRIITREGEHAVSTAPGAGDPSPAVAAALRAAVCGHASYRADPACHPVPGNSGGDGDAGGNAGGSAPRQ